MVINVNVAELSIIIIYNVTKDLIVSDVVKCLQLYYSKTLCMALVIDTPIVRKNKQKQTCIIKHAIS